MTATCPKCGKTFAPPPGSAGRSIRCGCGEVFVVREAPAEDAGRSIPPPLPPGHGEETPEDRSPWRWRSPWSVTAAERAAMTARGRAGFVAAVVGSALAVIGLALYFDARSDLNHPWTSGGYVSESTSLSRMSDARGLVLAGLGVSLLALFVAFSDLPGRVRITSAMTIPVWAAGEALVFGVVCVLFSRL